MKSISNIKQILIKQGEFSFAELLSLEYIWAGTPQLLVNGWITSNAYNLPALQDFQVYQREQSVDGTIFKYYQSRPPV
jgi:hypothetical protein